jgi:deoxyribodipyrimidine photolyase-related protein
MCEVTEESTYAPHHKKKIAFILSAMRHFAEELRAAGWEVDYVRLDDPGNTGTLTGELDRAAARWSPREISVHIQLSGTGGRVAGHFGWSISTA